MFEYLEQIYTDAGLVVVDVARGEYRHFPGRSLPVNDIVLSRWLSYLLESFRRKSGGPCVFMNAQRT